MICIPSEVKLKRKVEVQTPTFFNFKHFYGKHFPMFEELERNIKDIL